MKKWIEKGNSTKAGITTQMADINYLKIKNWYRHIQIHNGRNSMALTINKKWRETQKEELLAAKD